MSCEQVRFTKKEAQAWMDQIWSVETLDRLGADDEYIDEQMQVMCKIMKKAKERGDRYAKSRSKRIRTH